MYQNATFPKQFSFKKSTGLKQLGLGFVNWASMETIGLKSPKSFLNDTVLDLRHNLTYTYHENMHYLRYSRPLTS